MTKDNFIRTSAILEVTSPQLPSKRWNTRSGTKLSWGVSNALGQSFGDQVFEIYQHSQLLRSIIALITDELTSSRVVKDIVRSYILYGFAVIRLSDNALLDSRYIRTNALRSKFWYRLPAMPEETYNANEVMFITDSTVSADMPYPTPIIYPVLKSAQVLCAVDNWHINEISNGFSANVMISLCNGVPPQNEREEIEQSIMEKFSGSENAGRFILNFCSDEKHASRVDTIPVNDYHDRFTSLVDYCVNQIYSVFHCTPSLLGLVEGLNTGFNAVEYRSQLLLFRHFTIKPIKDMLESFLINIPEPSETILDVLTYMNETGLDATTISDNTNTTDKIVEEKKL